MRARGRRRGGRRRRPRPAPAFQLADPELQETAGLKVAIAITRRGGEKFFAAAVTPTKRSKRLAGENKPLPKFPLAGTLRAKTAIRHDTVEAPNVVGMVPGSDPKLKDEYVVMSAHLDHLGAGRAVNGDSINNGAMDDASGVASVLEIARLMKESGMKPKRSVIFLTVTAEEKGELGIALFRGASYGAGGARSWRTSISTCSCRFIL